MFKSVSCTFGEYSGSHSTPDAEVDASLWESAAIDRLADLILSDPILSQDLLNDFTRPNHRLRLIEVLPPEIVKGMIFRGQGYTVGRIALLHPDTMVMRRRSVQPYDFGHWRQLAEVSPTPRTE